MLRIGLERRVGAEDAGDRGIVTETATATASGTTARTKEIMIVLGTAVTGGGETEAEAGVMTHGTATGFAAEIEAADGRTAGSESGIATGMGRGMVGIARMKPAMAADHVEKMRARPEMLQSGSAEPDSGPRGRCMQRFSSLRARQHARSLWSACLLRKCMVMHLQCGSLPIGGVVAAVGTGNTALAALWISQEVASTP